MFNKEQLDFINSDIINLKLLGIRVVVKHDVLLNIFTIILKKKI